MTKKDVEEVKRVLKEGIQDAVAPLQLKVQEHRIVLFGVEGNDGINKSVATHEEEITRLRLWQAKVIGIAGVLSAVGGFAGSMVAKVLIK
jgi:hypothetical protein